MQDLRHILRRPIHLLLDWDGTLTKKDTLALVGSIAYQRDSASTADLPPWSFFVDAYISDYTSHQTAYTPPPSSRQTIQAERAWLASLSPIESRSVHRVETSSLFAGTTLNDVHSVAVRAVESNELQLRPGWLPLLRQIRGEPVLSPSATPQSRVSILSVNWSKQFIRSALRTCLAKAPKTTSSPLSPTSSQGDVKGRSGSGSFDGSSAPAAAAVGMASPPPLPLHDPLDSYVLTMEIIANEIDGLMTKEGSSGRLSKSETDAGIRTAGDKLAHLPVRCRRRLDRLSISDPSQQAAEVEASPGDATGAVRGEEDIDDDASSPLSAVVYVGDSATDLECLLAADVGICIRDTPAMGSSQRELAETLERLGITCLHISQGLSDKDEDGAGVVANKGKERVMVVYWARDLQEIADLLNSV